MRKKPEKFVARAEFRTLARAVKMVATSNLSEVERLDTSFKALSKVMDIIGILIERVAPEELLTRKRAAKLLGVGERTLKRWADVGLVPVVKRKGRGKTDIIRYRLADLTKTIQKAGTSRWGSRTRG